MGHRRYSLAFDISDGVL